MILRLRWLLALSAIAPIGVTAALAGPNGATVAGGAASVQGQGTAAVVVTQTSQNAIINWQTFNIGAGETTKIIMPGAGATELDRVTGNLGPSQIFGSLTSNGQVFLVNPDGILFGPNSRINAAGFLATTHDIANGDFMAGRYNFTGAGNPAASIVNQGSITAQSGGFAALVAPGVRNTGTITAWLGRVGLASANTFALDLYGDRLIQLNVGDAIAAQVIDVSTGQPLKALVSNEGTIKADGGRVELTAVAARQVVDSVINNTGVIEANSIGSRNGMIELEAATAAEKPAGAPLQLVNVSGTLSAAGKRKGTSGGTVVVTGESVTLTGAKIDASGSAGGGAVLIGGDWGGGHPDKTLVTNRSAYLEPFTVPTATTVAVDAATTITASATSAGNGGKVVVWSTAATTFYGSLAATGGAQSGNGGFVETSGGTVNFAGIRVDTSAPAGKTGTWLVDPTDLTVDAATAATISSNLATTGVTLQTTAGGATGPGVQTSGAGDIIVNAPISWSSNKTLTLDAYNAITFNAAVTVTGAGALVLTATSNPLASAAPLISFGSGASVQFTGTPGSGQSLTINNQAYTLLYSMSEVQNINNNLAGYYALAVPLNASGVTNWMPLGTDGAGNVLNSGNGFTGTFQGLGNTISNLTINLPSSNYVGLFGYVGGTIGSNGLIQNLGLAGGSVTGGSSAVGGLIGQSAATVTNVYSTGTVSGSSYSYDVGGLIGNNRGTVSNAYTTGTVSGYSAVGGLVGYNVGTVSLSHATVSVQGTGGDDVGGLVGYNEGGTVTQSYATGNVAGPLDLGGLVGDNSGGTVTLSYATGKVTGTNAYSDYGVGGLVGYMSWGSVAQSYATGAVSAPGYVGGLVGWNGGTVTQSYSIGPVTGTNNFGGLVGYDAGGSVTSSYWNTQSSGQSASAGGTGLTTAGFQSRLPTGFDSTAWASNASINGGYPYLVWQSPSATAVTYSVANATSTYGTLATPGAVMLTGVASGATVTATVEVFMGSTPVTLKANTPAGTYTEEVVALSNPNYTIASSGNTNGTLTIDPATLTYTANAASRTYGAVNPLLSGTVAGFVAGDTLASATSGTLAFSTTATSGSSVGSYPITGSGLTAANYVFVQAAANSTALSIIPAPITVAALGGSSTYGISPANPGLSATGLQNGEGASVLAGLSNSFSITNSTSAGSYTLIVAGTLTNPNYTVTSTTSGSWTINPAPITVTALGGSSIYGSSPGNPGLSATGLQNGQTASVLTGLANAFGISNASNVGAYPVDVSGKLTNTNYTVTSLSAGTWTINPATLTYLADPVSIASGSAIPTLSGTVTGLVNGQTLAAVTTGTAVFSTTATSSSPAGGYPITGSGLTADTANYVLAQAPGNADAMTITPAGLTANQAQLVNPAQLTQFVQPITATAPSSGQVVVTETTPSPAHTGSVASSNSSGPAPQFGPRSFVPPPSGETRYVKNEVLLQVPSSVSAAEFQAMVERLHLTVLSTDELGLLGVTTYRLQIGSGSSVNSVIQALSGFQIVASAQANYTYRLAQDDTAPAAPASPAASVAPAAPATATQNTDLAGEEQQGDASQYELEKLGLRGVHRLVKGNNVKVAVIDSEIDLNHPDLRGTILEEYDAVGAEDRPDAHGTAMAGAIAAHRRLLGIAPSAQLYAIHAFSSHAASAQSTSFSIIKGLDWAVSKGVRVINMSFAGPRDPAMARALHAAHDAGIVLIAAAGNDGPKSPPLYPAADPDVIAVTATDIHDKVFLRANQGRYIAVAAPGVDIPVPAPEGAYQLTTGTSVASAEVSGMAALLIERNPSLTPDDIRHILTSTARHRGSNGRNDVYGSGLVDPPSAVRAAAGARSAAREPAERAASATSPSVN